MELIAPNRGRALLGDPRYQERARALQAEYARYDAIALGVRLIERLAAGQSVLRGDVESPPHVSFASAAVQ